PSQPASSARQRRARSSLGATTTTVLRETSTSDAHANARAPAVASAILVERRSSRRSARSRNRSLRSASARMPPRRADVSAAVLAIELVHRALDAVADRDLRGLGASDDHLVRLGALIGRERREHVLREVGDLDGRIHRGDAEPQAWKRLADLARDRAHTVVRPRTATLPQSHLAERQVDLVEDDEERVRRQPVAVEELPDGSAAVVHERLRPRDRDPQVAERTLGDARLRRLGVELEPRPLGEPVRYLETDVVARVRVPVAGITKAGDE